MPAKKISLKTLATYAGLLGRGSLAYMAYEKAKAAIDDGLPVSITMVNNGFAVSINGCRKQYA